MMRLMMLGALLGTLPAASAQPDAEAVPLSLYQGKQFTVEAVVAGKSRTFLFDTGEGLTMIDPGLAKEIGCEPWGNVTAFRMTGDRLDAKRCDGVSFAINARRYVAPSTLVYDLSEIAGKDEPPLAGSIGLPRGLAWMELDTGNAGPTIFVSQAMAPLFGLDPATREPQDVAIRLGAAQLKTRARVFPNMVMDGNIGMQLVRDRVITLDLKDGRAWLAPSGGTL